MNVISHREIRDLMKMGAKYREPSCIWFSNVDSVSNFVNLNLVHILRSVNILLALFNRVVEVLDNRIMFFSSCWFAFTGSV